MSDTPDTAQPANFSIEIRETLKRTTVIRGSGATSLQSPGTTRMASIDGVPAMRGIERVRIGGIWFAPLPDQAGNEAHRTWEQLKTS